MTVNEPIALPCYEAMAEAYAAAVDAKPFNAYYERPAVLSLLPPIAGRRVLDVGCGSGWYAEVLVEGGAIVTAIDVSPKMVAFTRVRLGDRAQVLQADLGQPLDFAADATFDLVLCPLVLHYLEHWEPVCAEFHRILQSPLLPATADGDGRRAGPDGVRRRTAPRTPTDGRLSTRGPGRI